VISCVELLRVSEHILQMSGFVGAALTLRAGLRRKEGIFSSLPGIYSAEAGL
jgi:hypothetical protein